MGASALPAAGGTADERRWTVAMRTVAASNTLEIAIYDQIGKDWLFGEGFSAGDFLAKLRAAPAAKAIDLRVNSNGGLIDDAKAMVNLMGERASAGVAITGFVDGMAASSASYLLTAAHRVVMPSNAFMMLHEARAGQRGRASDMEAAADFLRRTNDQLAEAYAAASARRGKNKTKADYLAAMASGDVYLTASEAVDWGLADEQVAALQVAASLCDISTLPENAPELLRAAPYVVRAQVTPPPTEPATPPAPQPPPVPPPVPPINQEDPPMAFSKLVLAALSITDEAVDDTGVVAAINKLKTSAKIGGEIEQLLGATGQGAVGAVRALQATQEAHATLNIEVSKLKVVNARRDFDGALAKGLDQKDRKLTPAMAKRYRDKFDAALKVDDAGDAAAVASAADKASEVVEDLVGFLAVANRISTGVAAQGGGSGGGENLGGPMTFNGKAFEAMNGVERKSLKDQNPELYTEMREDAVARKAI